MDPSTRPDASCSNSPRPAREWGWLPQAVLSVGFAIWCVAFATANRIEDIFDDEWRVFAVRESKPYLAYLFSSHNGHQIPILKLILDADDLLGGSGRLALVLAFSFVGIAISALWVLLRRIDDVPLRRTVLFFLGFCLLWASLFYGLIWRFSVHAPMTIAAFLVAVLGLVEFVRREDQPDRQRWLALSMTAATVSTFSCATGAATWGTLIAVALVARLRISIVVALTAGLLVSIFVLTFDGRVGQLSALDHAVSTLENPWKLIGFTARFVGLPIGQAAEGLSELMGGDPSPVTGEEGASTGSIRSWTNLRAGSLAIIGAAIYIFRQLLRRSRDPLALLAVALLAFGIGAAVMTAPARSLLNDGDANRFTLWSITVWMGWVVAAADSVVKSQRRRLRHALLIVLPCLTLAMLPAMRAVGPISKRIALLSEQTRVLLISGIFKGEALRRTGVWRPEHVRQALPALERGGLGPYADPRRLRIGRPLSEIGKIGHCEGKIYNIQPIAQNGKFGALVNGSLVALDPDALPRIVWTADLAGVVTGTGTVDDLTIGSVVQWYATVRPAEPQSYSVFAQLHDDTLCPLGRFMLPGRKIIRKSPARSPLPPDRRRRVPVGPAASHSP